MIKPPPPPKASTLPPPHKLIHTPTPYIHTGREGSSSPLLLGWLWLASNLLAVFVLCGRPSSAGRCTNLCKLLQAAKALLEAVQLPLVDDEGGGVALVEGVVACSSSSSGEKERVKEGATHAVAARNVRDTAWSDGETGR